MIQNKIIPCMRVAVIVAIINVFCIPGTAAQKRNPASKFPRQRYVPARQVLKDFNRAYKSPPDAKTMKTYYAGKIRTYRDTVDEARVRGQSHQVAVVYRLTKCGIRMRDIWEVRYYELEGEWIFKKASRLKSVQLTRPLKRAPGLADADIQRLVSGAFMKRYGYRVRNIEVIGKKGYWMLCTPMYDTRSKITVAFTDDISNEVSTYECVIAATLARKEGKWEDVRIGCVVNGRETGNCLFATSCIETSHKSSIPEISDEDGASLLRAAFENEYGLIKNNLFVERFELIKRMPVENFNKTYPCIVRAVFDVDEEKNMLTTESGTEVRTLKKKRAVYECFVYGRLNYSLIEKRWRGIIDYCCASKGKPCTWPCSDPGKGCKRIGEK
jgi:hypothetical protein